MNLAAVVVSCAALFVLMTPPDAAADPVPVTVRVDNVTPNGGAVRVAMFDQQNWLDEPVAAQRAEPAGVSVTFSIVAPGPGAFGFVAYQDSNGDGRLNRNVVGMPTEPWAASNAASAYFGPPSFQDAAVNVSAATQTVITLR
ncbi:MAG: DUF2141 domain-containing protein [Hyphomonadaceae bacterium]